MTSQNPSFRYSLILFLTLALFLCAVFFYIRNTKNTALNQDVTQLITLREDYSQIDSCIAMLYQADNNCRLFAATGKKVYMDTFSFQINEISNKISQIHQQAEQKASSSKQNLNALLAQKKVRTALYVRLKQLTDSLINVSSKIDQSSLGRVRQPATAISFGQVKKSIAVDTIKEATKPQKQKKLFGRIADAIANRKNNKHADTTKKLVRTATELNASIRNTQSNLEQYRKMDEYFRKLYSTNNQLKKNEIIILQLNNRLVAEILNVLQNYKNQEQQFASTHKVELKDEIDVTFKSIDRIFILSISLLILMVAFILYNLWKVYQHEHELINTSQKASQVAIAKSKFLANMSHEIRTPLNSVIGFSEQLAQSDLNEKQAEQLQAIQSSSVMLLDLVNDILDFSKYETYTVNFDKFPFSPLQSLQEVLNGIGIQAKQKHIDLLSELAIPADVKFIGDSLRLKQVVMNLLSNAIKFTNSGGVTLKAGLVAINKKQMKLNVQVVDTGIGIGAKDLSMIFDEFAQVNYVSTTAKPKGTGLGLAISKKIVEFQQGEIKVSSEPGKGSIFSFSIPYELTTAENAIPTTNTDFDFTQLKGKRILLADDNKMNILLAKTVISKYHLLSDAAEDGLEALELFDAHNYDLVLTDIQMPKINGVELSKAIRSHQNANKSNVAILGVTANVLPEDRALYLSAGMNDLVLKPFSEKELMTKIAQHVTI